jgi:hypothetical protein
MRSRLLDDLVGTAVLRAYPKTFLGSGPPSSPLEGGLRGVSQSPQGGVG